MLRRSYDIRIIASFPVKVGGARTMDDIVCGLSKHYRVSKTINEENVPTTKGGEKIAQVVYIPYCDFELRNKALASGVYELPTYEIGMLAAEQAPEMAVQNVCMFLSRNERLQCPFGCPMGLVVENRNGAKSIGFSCLPLPWTVMEHDLFALCKR